MALLFQPESEHYKWAEGTVSWHSSYDSRQSVTDLVWLHLCTHTHTHMHTTYTSQTKHTHTRQHTPGKYPHPHYHHKHVHTHTNLSQLALSHWWWHLCQPWGVSPNSEYILSKERASLFWQVWLRLVQTPAGEEISKTRQIWSEVPLCCGGHVLPQQSHAGDGKAIPCVSPLTSCSHLRFWINWRQKHPCLGLRVSTLIYRTSRLSPLNSPIVFLKINPALRLVF